MTLSLMIDKLVKRWAFDPNEKLLLDKPIKTSNCKTKQNKIIIIQAPPVHYYLCLYANLISFFKENNSVTIIAIYPNLFSPKPKKNYFFISYLLYSADAFFIKRKWEKLYKAIGVESFLKLDNSNIFKKAANFLTAIKVWRSLKTKEDLLVLSVDGIKCGDLIYDTYLRYEAKPTVYIKDTKLIYYIYKCHIICSSFVNKIDEMTISDYFSSYSSYIHHGVPVRLFLRHNVNVFTSGNLQQKFKKLTLQDSYHTAPHLTYKVLFNKLDDKSSKIALGMNSLNNKFNGLIDQATSYMKKSVFNNEESEATLFVDKYDGVVFLHDFFDSPHIYSNMLFADFYDWATHTLNLIQKHKLNIAIKPHPNQTVESKKIIEQLKKEYKNIEWIEPIVSNSVILKSRIRFGISVYGTVLHELAFHGKNPICAGDNPHAAFNFIHTPLNIQLYDEMIINHEKLLLPKNYLEEVAIFYYMHNIHDKEDFPTPSDTLKDYNVFNSDSKLILKII